MAGIQFPDFPEPAADAADLEIEFDEPGSPPSVATPKGSIDDFFNVEEESATEDEPKPDDSETVLSAADVMAVLGVGEDGSDPDTPDASGTPAGMPDDGPDESDTAPQAQVSGPPAARRVTVENMPPWAEGLLEKQRSSVSHAFLLDFNVHDYAYGTLPLRDFLVQVLDSRYSYHIIAYYNLADGIHFPSWGEETYRERFLEATGLAAKQEALASDETRQQLEKMGLASGGEYEEGGGEPALPDSPAAVLQLLRPLFEKTVSYEGEEQDVPCILLYVDSLETVVPDAELSQMRLQERQMLLTLREIASSNAADSTNNVLIMTTENSQDVHKMLRMASARIEKVTVPRPDREERMAFVRDVLVVREQETGVSLFDEKLTAEVMANLSAGLSRMQMEDIALRAESRGTAITEQLVKERKSDIISSEYGDVIEILDPAYTFDDIGGMETVKRYFIEEVIAPIRSGDLWRVPQGVLLLGAAGTGKTMVAHAVASESRMNCVNLDLSKVLNKYVGDSEKNFDRALLCVRSMEPTVVLVEEIDQTFPNRANDNTNVSNRIFKRFLEFMSDPDKRGHVLVIATSNYPSRMDPALRRPGRFDKKIPFFVPGQLERLRIIQAIAARLGWKAQIPSLPADPVMFAKYEQDLLSKIQSSRTAQGIALCNEEGESGRKASRVATIGRILDKTETMTGAELETIVQKAISIGLRGGRKAKAVLLADLLAACDVIVPSTSAIAEMTDEALRECNDLDFVPEKYRERVSDIKEEEASEVTSLLSAGTLLD